MNHALPYIFGAEVQEMLDLFSGLFGVRIALFSSGGEELKSSSSHKEMAPYCRFVRGPLGLGVECDQCDRSHRNRAARLGHRHTYTCHAGLTESVIPLEQEGSLVGYVMVGQFRTEDKGEQLMKKLAGPSHAAVDRPLPLLALWEQTPSYSVPDRDRMLQLLDLLVRYISSQHLVRRRHPTTIDPILDYLREKIDQPVTLKEVAAMSHRSESTISHLFQKQVGKRFKQVQIEMKLNHADQLLTQQPELTIQQVAARVGYHDPLYFSRLYRQHRNTTPTQTRRGDGSHDLK
jgi:AraC-like DNA-binding protein/ligand-binding sensor protein